MGRVGSEVELLWKSRDTSKVFVYICVSVEGVSSFVGGLLSSSLSFLFSSPPSNPQAQSSLQGMPQICLYVRTTPSCSSFCCPFSLSFCFISITILYFTISHSLHISIYLYLYIDVYGASENIWTCLDT